MRDQAFRQVLLAGFAIAFGLLVVVGVLAYRRVLTQDADQVWIQHTHLTIEKIEAVRGDLLDEDAQLSAYLLSGNLEDLTNYNTAARRSLADLEEFGRLTRDNPAQQASVGQVQGLIRADNASDRNLIDLRREGRTAAALAAFEAEGRSAGANQTSELIDRIKGREEDLLQRRLSEAGASLRLTRRFVFFGYGLALAFLLAAAVLSRRQAHAHSLAETALQLSEQRFRLLVSHVKDYAIFVLDPKGRVASWNTGAERLKGYREQEALGLHFSVFYPHDENVSGKPEQVLDTALREGSCEFEGWRVRKDGSRFWADVTVTPLRDPNGVLTGFGKITRDMTEHRRLFEELQLRNAQLEASNKELEAFSYSVSHDLRAPLRAIEGFSRALMEDCAAQLSEEGMGYLRRVCAATERMAALIDDLLNLSRVTRVELRREPVDLTAIAESIVADLRRSDPARQVEFVIGRDLYAQGDPRLLRCVLENLLGNSWKFTGPVATARVEFGQARQNGSASFFVQDNGVGFDPAHAARLFQAFQRLHALHQFPGTGVGLATVQRIVKRHGGTVWASAAVGQGATFYFTLQAARAPQEAVA